MYLVIAPCTGFSLSLSLRGVPIAQDRVRVSHFCGNVIVWHKVQKVTRGKNPTIFKTFFGERNILRSMWQRLPYATTAIPIDSESLLAQNKNFYSSIQMKKRRSNFLISNYSSLIKLPVILSFIYNVEIIFLKTFFYFKIS